MLNSCISYGSLNCFSAHTKESAKALVDTIQMTFPGARLALVVAMASDKDHVGFAREFLSGIVVSNKLLVWFDHKDPLHLFNNAVRDLFLGFISYTLGE